MLKDVLTNHKPDLVSLSEPQTFQCDAEQLLECLDGDYCYRLNSDDLLDPELPLVKTRSLGGTMTLWKKQLDPFIEIYNTSSTAFLPVILRIPGIVTSIHITIYLPTHGKDSEFVSELAGLRVCIDELNEKYSDPIIFVRGDGNVNPKNSSRVTLLQQFLCDYSLAMTDVPHSTYHHFVGNGSFDSKIDILLCSAKENVSEYVSSIMCKHDHPGIMSHHDIIISKFTVPTCDIVPVSTNLLTAPKV